MKTELRPVAHSITGAPILEVWYDGRFIATITVPEGPGIRVISKRPMQVIHIEGAPNVVEVQVSDGKEA